LEERPVESSKASGKLEETSVGTWKHVRDIGGEARGIQQDFREIGGDACGTRQDLREMGVVAYGTREHHREMGGEACELQAIPIRIYSIQWEKIAGYKKPLITHVLKSHIVISILQNLFGHFRAP
jgi:hypothetical protein